MDLKKVIYLLVIVLLVSGTVLAEEEVEVLNLKDCLKRVVNEHPDLELAKYNLDEKKMELKKLKLENPENIPEKKLTATKDSLEEAKKDLLDTRIQLALNVERKYYQVLKSLQTLESQKRNLEWINKQLDIAQVKFERGLISKNDLNSLQKKKKLTAQGIKYASLNLDTAKMEFNIAMGWELGKKFKFESKEIPYSPIEVDLAKSVKYAVSNLQSIQEAKDGLADARDNLDLKNNISAAKIEVTQAVHRVQRAEINLEKAKKNTVIKVRNTYLNLVQSRDQVENANWDYQQAQKDLNALEVKYKAGMIPLMDLIDGHNTLTEAEIDWIQAIYDYNLAKGNFHLEIGKKRSLYQQLIDGGKGSGKDDK